MTHLTRTALIMLACACLAACSTYEPFEASSPGPARPAYPIQLPPPATSPPQQTPPAPAARPTQPVQSGVLPPAAPSNQPGYVTPSTPPAPPAAAPPLPPARATPAPPPPPAPPRTVTKTSVTGKVVDAEGPAKSYTVAKGDSLDAIGRKMGLGRKELADLNDLKPPYALKPGQELKGPKSTAKAYVVTSGDTLLAIGRRFGVTAQQLADENDIKVTASLRVGQKLRLPDGYKDKGPIKTTVQVEAPLPPPAPPPPPAAPPSARPPLAPPPAWAPPTYPPSPAPMRPAPASPSVSTPHAPPAPPSSAPAPAPIPVPPAMPRPAPPPVSTAPAIVPSTPVLSDSQLSQLGRGRFIWPLRGELISTFGPKGTGQRNDGVNIRVNSGDVVRSAASGDVVYAGDQVPGFGNLVLVKHADGWVTAYGHLSRVDVKMQQKVTQGQQLGQAGSTGGVSEPQLHFEVRYAPTPADRARPIDPNLVLPR